MLKIFLLGLKEAGEDYDFYAFSDQDDIWEKDKIIRGIDAINLLDTKNSAYQNFIPQELLTITMTVQKK